MRIKFCPRCKSQELDLVAGGTIGNWKCRKCGYTGSVFPEKEVQRKKKKTKEKTKKNKNRKKK